jgi:hypothetical protein
MNGIDYLGPFNPVCDGSNNQVVSIAFETLSRYTWAWAVEQNEGDTAVGFLLKEVVNVFGWPSAVCSDNGSHFVQGKLPLILKANDIRHFPLPKVASWVSWVDREIRSTHAMRSSTSLVAR